MPHLPKYRTGSNTSQGYNNLWANNHLSLLPHAHPRLEFHPEHRSSPLSLNSRLPTTCHRNKSNLWANNHQSLLLHTHLQLKNNLDLHTNLLSLNSRLHTAHHPQAKSQDQTNRLVHSRTDQESLPTQPTPMNHSLEYSLLGPTTLAPGPTSRILAKCPPRYPSLQEPAHATPSKTVLLTRAISDPQPFRLVQRMTKSITLKP